MKKIISLILAFSLVFALAVPGFASDSAERPDKKILPHINIRGFMCCPLYEDKTDPDSTQIWPPQGDEIKKAVFELLPDLIKYMFTHKGADFMDDLVPKINRLFNPLTCNADGDPIIEGSGAYQKYPSKEEILANPTIAYAYDWRLDPLESADDLNDFINYLCDDLGFGQVVIEVHSNAGNILLSYLSKYGTEKIYSCCFSATAVYGAGFAAELIQGRVLIDGKGVTEYLLNILSNNDKAKLISFLINLVSRIGILDWLSGLLNTAVQDGHRAFYADCVFPIFGHWLNIWAMVPDEYLESGINYCHTNFGFEKDGKYKEFFEKIDCYSNTVRKTRESTLDKTNKDCNMYVFCFYGMPGIPIASDWNVMSDGVLYSKDTSFGAGFKDFISTDRFKAGDYVSPDGLCDGSTAKFKDYTWYFYGCNHLYKSDFLDEMAKELLWYDGQADVNTFAEYPQFMKFSPVARGVVPNI